MAAVVDRSQYVGIKKPHGKEQKPWGKKGVGGFACSVLRQVYAFGSQQHKKIHAA